MPHRLFAKEKILEEIRHVSRSPSGITEDLLADHAKIHSLNVVRIPQAPNRKRARPNTDARAEGRNTNRRQGQTEQKATTPTRWPTTQNRRAITLQPATSRAMNARKTRAISKISLRITRTSTVSLSVGDILGLQNPNHHDLGLEQKLRKSEILPTCSGHCADTRKRLKKTRCPMKDIKKILPNNTAQFSKKRLFNTQQIYCPWKAERLAVKISHHATRSVNDLNHFSHACADQTLICPQTHMPWTRKN